MTAAGGPGGVATPRVVLVDLPTRFIPPSPTVGNLRNRVDIMNVTVGGTCVVRDHELALDALPGKPVRAAPR